MQKALGVSRSQRLTDNLLWKGTGNMNSIHDDNLDGGAMSANAAGFSYTYEDREPMTHRVSDERASYYFQVENDMFDSGAVAGLRASSFVVYCYLARRTNVRTDDAWPGLTDIGTKCGMGRGTVVAAIAELETAGLLIVDRGGKTNHYRVQSPKIELVQKQNQCGSKTEPEVVLKQNSTGSKTELKEELVSKPIEVDQLKKNKRAREPDQSRDEFEDFWSRYPIKSAKQSALKAWLKIAPNQALRLEMQDALERQKVSDQWQRGFVPYASTWLNGERWNDELPAAREAKKTPEEISNEEWAKMAEERGLNPNRAEREGRIQVDDAYETQWSYAE